MNDTTMHSGKFKVWGERRTEYLLASMPAGSYVAAEWVDKSSCRKFVPYLENGRRGFAVVTMPAWLARWKQFVS